MLKPADFRVRLIILLASALLSRETFRRRFRHFCAGFGFNFCGIQWGNDFRDFDWTAEAERVDEKYGEPKLRGNMRCGR